MQALADDARDKTSGSAYKAAAKEKFTRFYDLFEEVGERHRMARVLEEDSEERSAVGEEVVKLIVPSLQQFMQKQKEKEFSKSEHRDFSYFVMWNALTVTVTFTRSTEV
jgi:exocyst complex protein 7